MSEQGLITANAATSLVNIDQIAQAARRELLAAKGIGHEMVAALTLARGIQMLRELLTDQVMQDVMALQNTELGFLTDRDPKRTQGATPYQPAVIRDVMIAALLDGAKLTGGEFCVIAGKYYRALPQFERRIREYPGLTNFRMKLGVPHVQGDGALVDVRATWTLDGKPGLLECKREQDHDSRIPVRVNKGMGLDAILGKAKRKFLARVLDHLDGTAFEHEDSGGAVIDAVTVESTPEVDQTVDELATMKASALAKIAGHKDPEAVDSVVKRFGGAASKLGQYDIEAIDAAFLEVQEAAQRRKVSLG